MLLIKYISYELYMSLELCRKYLIQVKKQRKRSDAHIGIDDDWLVFKADFSSISATSWPRTLGDNIQLFNGML